MKLGKVETIEPRGLWPDEAKDFTPWLASADGLELLAETINEGELELVETEKNVGLFKADILCRVTGEEDHLVVIENQFEPTDHDHLGKLITYASGLKAKTVVWISEEFRDEHRQAIDWLNENQIVRFFGLEVFGIKIADSPPAPQFKVVSSPNVWAQAVQESKDVGATSTELDQQQFWEEVRETIKVSNPSLRLQKPQPQAWYPIAIGRANMHLSLTVNTRVERVGCELYLQGAQAKQAFDLLEKEKAAIEKELGYDVEWQRLEGKTACRIVAYKDGSIYDAVQRQELKSWLTSAAEQFYKVFALRVKALKLTADSGS
ncbi:MAG: DUF4268 domain-containing protein [Chloroflexi bacterium]|nr:DUF4268 domain-containing protein [Chloroflexota bacterium]